MAKLVFVTGGVVSSLGKGIAASSMGALCEAAGYKVTFLKFDPYINIDPGTMSPYQHGEVYVTDDGSETDLDLGHYERYVDVRLGKKNNYTTGQIYAEVIRRERRGEYNGSTVQVIPHITDEIKRCVYAVEEGVDIVFVEIGGTVGDIEGQPFYEAIRQLMMERGAENALSVHLTWLPYISSADELKTKPTQHSVKELRSIGIQPTLLFCRAETVLQDAERNKIGLFTNVEHRSVYSLPDVVCIYEVITNLYQQNLLEDLASRMNLSPMVPDLSIWQEKIDRHYHPTRALTIGLVGKYTEVKDAYLSLVNALYHSSLKHAVTINVKYIDAEKLDEIDVALSGIDAVIVPGGFGDRGVEGKIAVAAWCLEKKMPYLGICLGMQVAVIAWARMHGLQANSTEFDIDVPCPVVLRMDQMERSIELRHNAHCDDVGGTLRLGLLELAIKDGTLLKKIYGSELISERHRHRYEVNPAYHDFLQEKGMTLSASSHEGLLVEAVEVSSHPWFVACQFHPEFLSTPKASHPLFDGLVSYLISLPASENN